MFNIQCSFIAYANPLSRLHEAHFNQLLHLQIIDHIKGVHDISYQLTTQSFNLTHKTNKTAKNKI